MDDPAFPTPTTIPIAARLFMAGWDLTYQETMEQWVMDPRLMAAYLAMEKLVFIIMEEMAVSVAPEVIRSAVCAMKQCGSWSSFWSDSEMAELAEAALSAKLNQGVFKNQQQAKEGG